MAIIKPTDPTLANQVIDNMLIVKTKSGTYAGQLANNNRSGPQQGATAGITGSSATFKNLDQAIRNADAEYDQLADKTPWETYAANIAGLWQLCANCQPDAAAKKLYRQYNINRSLIGLAPVTAPVDNTEYCSSQGLNFFHNTPANTPGGECLFVGEVIDGPAWFVACINGSLTNPIIESNQAADTFFLGGSPQYSFTSAIATAAGVTPDSLTEKEFLFRMCCFNPTGAPGLSYTAVIQINTPF